MNKLALASKLDVSVVVTNEVVSAEIHDRRSDTAQLFMDVKGSQRDELALEAWHIGLKALSNAYATAQEARLQDVGAALVADVDRQLQAHITKQQETIAAVLSRFFDPKDGHVTQRLAAFVDDQGVLARLLEKYLAPNNSVLAQTLARQVGESSPLFKKLSPTDSDGLLQLLEAHLRQVMAEEHDEMVRALDPLAEGGAVARFLKSLRDELRSADEDRAKQLESALAALNANDENSLISRLVRESNRARQALMTAVNPDAPESPMAIMKTSLSHLLKEHASQQSAVLAQQEARQKMFEAEVRDALSRLETRRSAAQTSPRGGLDFEQAVMRMLLDTTRSCACTVEATGNTPGARTRSKKGDAVIRFTAESAFAGAGVVIEAKHDASYTTQQALTELDEARKNRDACAGVFIMAASHASDLFPRFSRYGSNVLVVWDEEDSATDPYLNAAILLGMALASRAQRVGSDGDLNALRDVESRFEQELKRLAGMERHNSSIRKHSDDLADEIRKAQKQLEKLVADTRATLAALNVTVADEAAERRTPLVGGVVAALPARVGG